MIFPCFIIGSCIHFRPFRQSPTDFPSVIVTSNHFLFFGYIAYHHNRTEHAPSNRYEFSLDSVGNKKFATYHVRFFGPGHERAWVMARNLREFSSGDQDVNELGLDMKKVRRRMMCTCVCVCVCLC